MHEDKSQEWRDGYITAKKEVYDAKQKLAVARGKARWDKVSLEERLAFMESRRRELAKVREEKKAQISEETKT